MPVGARGEAGTRTVHWVQDPTASDRFFAGAMWALSVAFDKLFGGILGPELLEQATNVEQWDGSQWVPLA